MPTNSATSQAATTTPERRDSNSSHQHTMDDLLREVREASQEFRTAINRLQGGLIKRRSR